MAEAADAMGLSGDAAPWGSGPPPQGYAYSPEQVRQVPRPSTPAPAAPANDTGPLSIPPEAQQFIKVVRTHEGTAEGAGFKLYGQGAGQSFQPGAEHPADTGWQGGHGPDGRETHAAGPGQWQPATWHGEADRIKKMGVEPNFADQNQQNWAIWDLGSRAYKARTGTDLQTAIKEGKADYTELGEIWSSLKRGVTPNLVNGPFNETAQPIFARWDAEYEKAKEGINKAEIKAGDFMAAAKAEIERVRLEADKPPKNMHEAWSQWSGVAGAFALLGGLVGRNHTAAIAAAGEMLQAANSADANAYDKAYKAWNDHLDRGMKIAEFMEKDARQVIADAHGNYDRIVSGLSTLSTYYGLTQKLDPKMIELNNLKNQRERADIIKANNEDANISSAATEMDKAWLEKHSEAKGTVPPQVHNEHMGLARKQNAGTTAGMQIFTDPTQKDDKGNPIAYMMTPGHPESAVTLSGQPFVPTGVQKLGSAGQNPVSPADTAATAKAVSEYRQAPPTGYALRSEWGRQVMKQVNEMNPEYDQGKWQAHARGETAFGVGKQGDTVRSFSVAIDHSATLEEAFKALENGDTQKINQAKNYLQTQLGYSGPTTFEAMKNFVGSEFSKAVVGGQGALMDREEFRNMFNSASSPAQMADVLLNAKKLMAGQIDGLARQAKSVGIPEAEFRAKLSTETQKMWDSLSRDKAGGGSATVSSPKKGDVQGGYLFKGGDPADKSNWERAPDGAVETR